MGNDWEALLTIGWLALWFLFPLGIFLSVGRLNSTTDQDIDLDEHAFSTRSKNEDTDREDDLHLSQWAIKH